MAEIPSDITGATVAEVTAYAAERGVTSWAALASDDLRSQALVRAWDYLESLDWMDDAFSDGLPDRVKTAHILFSIEEGESVGILAPTVTREDYIKRDGLGKGSLVTEYFQGAQVGTAFPNINRLISTYLLSSGMNMRVVRG